MQSEGAKLKPERWLLCRSYCSCSSYCSWMTPSHWLLIFGSDIYIYGGLPSLWKTGSCVMGILPPCRGAPMRFRFLQYFNTDKTTFLFWNWTQNKPPISHHIVVPILCPKPLCETFGKNLTACFYRHPGQGPHTKRGGAQHTHGRRSCFFVQQNSPWQGGFWSHLRV